MPSSTQNIKRLERRIYAGFELIGVSALDLADKNKREWVIKLTKDACTRLDKISETQDVAKREFSDKEIGRILRQIYQTVHKLSGKNVTDNLAISGIQQKCKEVLGRRKELEILRQSGVETQNGTWFESQQNNDFS